MPPKQRNTKAGFAARLKRLVSPSSQRSAHAVYASSEGLTLVSYNLCEFDSFWAADDELGRLIELT